MRAEKPSVKLEDWAVVESKNTASYQPLGPGNLLVGRAFGHQRIQTGMFIFTSPIVGVDAQNWKFTRILLSANEPSGKDHGVAYEILHLARPLLDTLPHGGAR